jgi:hypothetical protein
VWHGQNKPAGFRKPIRLLVWLGLLSALYAAVSTLLRQLGGCVQSASLRTPAVMGNLGLKKCVTT